MNGTKNLKVRLLESEEAGLLIGLIRRCYGETYIDASFYDEQVVRDRLQRGELSSVGAFLSGVLVGHMGITRRPWGGNTADAGMTLVDPAHRGQGIARQVAVGLAEQSVALGFVGVHDYPVTVHGATQRLAKGYGADTGLLLANMPADVSFEDMDTRARGARTSSLVRWLPFGRAPARTVYLPSRYAAPITSVYETVRLIRESVEAPEQPHAPATELDFRIDHRRQIGRLAALTLGPDVRDRLEAARDDAQEAGALVVHADLSLADPATPWAVEAIRDAGFFFAALLPEYRDGDTLRLQWLSPSVEITAADVLSSDATRAIEGFVLRDRVSVQGD